MHRTDVPYELILTFDGSCRPNPGGRSTYGWSLDDKIGRQLSYGSGVLETKYETDNNQAEWGALVQGLEYVNTLQGWKGVLTILGDSQLVIKQVNGIWSCRSPRLLIYYSRAREILLGKKWRAIWIHRSDNRYCDFLACTQHEGNNFEK